MSNRLSVGAGALRLGWPVYLAVKYLVMMETNTHRTDIYSMRLDLKILKERASKRWRKRD